MKNKKSKYMAHLPFATTQADLKKPKEPLSDIIERFN